MLIRKMESSFLSSIEWQWCSLGFKVQESLHIISNNLFPNKSNLLLLVLLGFHSTCKILAPFLVYPRIFVRLHKLHN